MPRLHKAVQSARISLSRWGALKTTGMSHWLSQAEEAHLSVMQKNPLLLAGTEIYRPLSTERQQFRLLTILPGHQSTKVCCILHTASLDHDIIPTYETISYAWGHDDHRSCVWVNGAIVNVPYNTMAALRRVRLPEDERVVWIDAVCTNQNDIAERSAQVAVMGTIYANGRENLVFLGDDEESVAGGVVDVLDASLQRISVAIEALSRREREDLRAFWALNPWEQNLILKGLDHNQYALLYSLPWFKRLWVLQEASLARQSRCLWGSSSFKLSDILPVAFVLATSPFAANMGDLGQPARHGILAASQMHTQILRFGLKDLGRERDSLWDVINSARHFIATDPRDYVFAPLQLHGTRSGRSRIPPSLLPDYHKSVEEVEEVFRDATQYLLEYEPGNRDRVLQDISHRSIEELEAGPPSWAVRMSRPYSETLDPQQLFHHRSGFRNGDGDFPQLLMKYFTERPDILGLFVHKVGSVSQITLVLQDEEEDGGFANMQKIVEEVATLTDFGDEMHAELLTIGDMRNFRDAEHRLEGYHCFLQHMEKHADLPPLTIDVNEEDEFLWAASSFWDTFSEMSNRRFFRTNNGYLGWGPKLMQESDILVVARGASVPYILRPVEEGYLFLGAAWVHGLMNGEVFDLDGEWEWVRIC